MDLSNLILLLQGKIFEGSAILQIKGYVSHPAMVEASNAVRNRLLELTIRLEKRIPNAASFELANIEMQPEVANQIFHQTIHGGMTSIHNTGPNPLVQIAVIQGSDTSLKNALRKAGFKKSDANELGPVDVQDSQTW